MALGLLLLELLVEATDAREERRHGPLPVGELPVAPLAVQRFVRDCCELGPDLRATGQELHRAYLDWSGLHRADRCSVQQFGAALMAVGKFGRDRSSPAQGFRKVWLGIGLRGK